MIARRFIDSGWLGLTRIRPWWVRLILLALLAAPLFGKRGLHPTLHDTHVFVDIGSWTAYVCFIWGFVFVCVGVNRLIDWLSTAFMLALVLLLTGALLRKLGVWHFIEELLRVAPKDPDVVNLALIAQFFKVIATYPLALLTLVSFPASDLVRWASQLSSRRPRTWTLRLAILLRMLQNVAEVVTRCMVAWREENPQLIVPRFRADWHGSLFSRLGILSWAKDLLIIWPRTVAMQSLQAVPFVVRDFRRLAALNPETSTNREE